MTINFITIARYYYLELFYVDHWLALGLALCCHVDLVDWARGRLPRRTLTLTLPLALSLRLRVRLGLRVRDLREMPGLLHVLVGPLLHEALLVLLFLLLLFELIMLLPMLLLDIVMLLPLLLLPLLLLPLLLLLALLLLLLPLLRHLKVAVTPLLLVHLSILLLR